MMLLPSGSAWRSGLLRLLALAALGITSAAFFAFSMPSIASAHARYASSDPAANAILKAAPMRVTIRFSEEVDPSGSGIIVYGATGKQVSTEQAEIDRTDLHVMSVGMRGDDSELYLVTWHTLSAQDGDSAIGAFTFGVDPAAAIQPGTPRTANSPGGASSAAPAAWLIVLASVLGVIVGTGGTLLAQRSRRGGTRDGGTRDGGTRDGHGP